MRKLTAAVIVAIVFGTVATAGFAQSFVRGQVEEAYAYTHGGYVGRAIVRVLNNGSLDVDIDEAFLPHTLAIVDLEGQWNENNTVYYLSRGNEVRVAKYIEYDGTTYVGSTVGSGLVYVEAGDSGEPAGGKDLELSILRNQATMAAYYENILSGNFKVLTGFGRTGIPVRETHYGGVTKNNSPGYWNFGQTWQGNIDAIEEFIEENGFMFSFSEMERAQEANADGLQLWSVADAVTGATNSDFKDYFSLVQLAAGRLKSR